MDGGIQWRWERNAVEMKEESSGDGRGIKWGWMRGMVEMDEG